MERKIGEIFEFQGKWYKAIEDKQNVCDECIFYKDETHPCDTHRDIVGWCSGSFRKDTTTVIFIEANKPTGIITSRSDKKKLLLII